MYQVSQAFLDAIKSNTRKYYWNGTITTTAGTVITFDENNIVKGSGNISSQCCANTEIELGTVYSSELSITMISQVDRYTLEDAIVEVFFNLQIAGGTYETVPMGIFEISEANRVGHCLEIKAYDYMLRFEKDFSNFESFGKAYDFLSLCSIACDVDLAQTQAEIEAMPNGDEILSIYTENDIQTYRDVLYYVAQVLGGFCVINRDGELEIRKYGNTPVLTVAQTHRYNSSFSDFITRYTAISSTNMRTETAEYYHLDPDDGLTMNLGINPLLQFGLDETRQELCENILDDISVINYLPFDSDTIGNPALDLGDVIKFSGGQADNSKMSAITAINQKIGGKQSLKCVGKNPRLAQAKSKNDKNISGLINQVVAGKIGIHTFTNASAYSIASSDTKIIRIEFATTEANHAQFFAQIVIDVDADTVSRSATASGTIVIPDPEDPGAEGQEVQASLPVTWTDDGEAELYVTYYFNNFEILTFHPEETWHSGKHILTLYYPIEDVIANTTNIFEVYLKMTGGTGDVATGDCIASISGQSMAASQEWDGTIEVEEEITLPTVTVTGLHPIAFTDAVNVALLEIMAFGVTDTIGRYQIGAFGNVVEVP